MMSARRRSTSLRRTIVAVCLMAACSPSESPVAPGEAPAESAVRSHVPPPSRARRSSAPNAQGVPQQPAFLTDGQGAPQQITIQDPQEGLWYTLDVASQEIRLSDGRVLGLDAELTAAVLPEFEATAGTELLVTDLETAVASQPQCGYGGPCDELRAEGGVRPRPRAPRSIVWRQAAPTRPQHRPQHRGRSKDGFSKPVISGVLPSFHRTAASGVVAVTLTRLAQTSTCTDILNAVIPATTTYRTERGRFVSEVVAAIGAEAFNRALDKTVRIASGQILAATLLERASLRYRARVAVSVLGAYYNMNNCGLERARAGPVLRVGTNNPGGGSGWVLRCHDENWEVSFDGEHWFPIVVSVCEYERAA